jgi:hypothetical protein
MALTKWVVPIDSDAIDDGSTEADRNMIVIAFEMPWLGSVVVGALCLWCFVNHPVGRHGVP